MYGTPPYNVFLYLAILLSGLLPHQRDDALLLRILVVHREGLDPPDRAGHSLIRPEYNRLTPFALVDSIDHLDYGVVRGTRLEVRYTPGGYCRSKDGVLRLRALGIVTTDLEN